MTGVQRQKHQLELELSGWALKRADAVGAAWRPPAHQECLYCLDRLQLLTNDFGFAAMRFAQL